MNSPIKNPEQFYIGGEWVEPTSASRFDVINCATEEHFALVAEAQEADMDRAVAAARHAFDHGPWPRMTHRERAAYLRQLAAQMDDMTERSAVIWSTETGWVHNHTRAAAATQGHIYRYYADLADTYAFVEPAPSQAEGYSGLLAKEPVGVVGAIIPWNGPPAVTTIKLAPALLAGCTVIIKASPQAPGHAYLVAEACEAIGLPPGVVNIVTADRAVSERLVRHPGVDKISFTGSTAAGRRIASICGERMARCTLELGGKSPAIICDDFDAAEAARRLAARAVFGTGQTCSLPTRIIVPRQKQDVVIDALRDYFSAVRIGDPFDADTDMGPIATRDQLQRIEYYIAKAQAEGNQLLFGGKRPPHLNRGFFIEPTLFGNVNNHDTIAREEVFGPVLAVLPVDSEQQAIEIANDSDYGLGGAVFTNDADRAYAIARQIRTGTVAHNGHRTEMLIGYGGFKQSGIGRLGGVQGLEAHLETKTIALQATPADAERLASQEA